MEEFQIKCQFAALKHITVILWLQIKVTTEAFSEHLQRNYGDAARRLIK